VVGADGINSLVASAVLGAEHDAPIFTNENIFYGVIDPPPAPEGDLGAPHELVQVGRCTECCSDDMCALERIF
jgi:hypothetical protein